MKTNLFNVEEYIERHNKVLKKAEEWIEAPDFKNSEKLEAANLAERGLGRIIGVAVDADRKAQAEAEADKTKNIFLEKLDKIAESSDSGDG